MSTVHPKVITVFSSMIAVITLAIAPAAAPHHSFPATYVEGETVRIEGELAAFMFRNPHSFVHVSVKDPAGGVVRYSVEWGAAAALGRQGIDRATLRPGDFVIISGLAGRNREDNRLLLRTIERPSDGFRWGFEEDESFE
jgi:hypothetical protein